MDDPLCLKTGSWVAPLQSCFGGLAPWTCSHSDTLQSSKKVRPIFGIVQGTTGASIREESKESPSWPRDSLQTPGVSDCIHKTSVKQNVHKPVSWKTSDQRPQDSSLCSSVRLPQHRMISQYRRTPAPGSKAAALCTREHV